MINIVRGTDQSETIIGTDGNDEIHDGLGTDQVHAGKGDDVFVTGTLSGDLLDGGAGRDTLVWSDAALPVSPDGDRSVIDLLSGTVRDPFGTLLATLVSIEGVDYTGPGAVIEGTGGANALYASGGSLVNARGGDDVIALLGSEGEANGGGGEDTLLLGFGAGDNTGYTVSLALPGQRQQFTTGEFHVLRAIENLAGSARDDTLTGDDGANKLGGGAGNDVLDGGAGADRMAGGPGDDTYTVDDVGDRVIEQQDAGRDRVYASVDFSLAANVEELFLQGSARHGTGNQLQNILVGSEGDDVLDGRGGADRMEGGLGDDTYHVDNAADSIGDSDGEHDLVIATASYSLLQAQGVEQLELLGTARRGTGNELDNTIIGNAADNLLDGGLGNDRLIGGLGNDTYVADSPYDQVVEQADSGTDTLIAAYDATLSTNLENLTLSGVASISGTGNARGNVLTGNSGNNVLDGKGGADRMIGGGGQDIFIVDNPDDTATGVGTVRASVSFTVSGRLDLVLTGSAAIDGTGSNRDNRLLGNGATNVLAGLGGNDVLDGGGGADRLKGGLGDDIYVVANAGVSVVEAADAGRDTVLAAVDIKLAPHVENLAGRGDGAIALSGNSGDNVIFGNGGDNAIWGGGGADLLWGIGGADTLTGGEGADHFVITTDDPSDTVVDFVSGSDTIVVVNDLLSGALLAGRFVAGLSARDADDFVLYDKASGQLYLDVDGNGPQAKVLLASFTPDTALAAADFEFVLRDAWSAQVDALDVPLAM